ncbi:23S rRNA pseudouridine(955/2504/2580) synthase RluC [Thioalkalivibrio sp. XN279]|uniref:23S rRNA pseudouridine(955/2504/2580) synthase RluC n=1 Tax=Thioalkalivibrio sp. XN279 TaxID=2714953 RepID=UPI00198002BB|nr:23S rRNA pseudouridine(955/2504/2580) synthase RluC [Thioalkalivibrio sp. XN279]
MASSSSPVRPAVEYVEITAEAAGQRLDNFLVTRLKGVPKSHVYRLLRKGEVRVNKGRAKPEYRLAAGDVVRLPPVRRPGPEQASPRGRAAGLRLETAILHEDERLIVLDKPAGIAVHGGSGLSHGVIEALRAARPDAPYLELVHRLDRETSGCLLVAKRRSALRALHELLRNGQIEKRYLALVQGRWDLGQVKLEDRLRKTIRGGERVVTVDESGKAAASIFRPVEIRNIASLLEVHIMTGRTHQIRVQAAEAGHPLAGDERYGDREFNRLMKTLGLERLFLHAASIGWEDPASGEWRMYSAPLPDDLRAVLSRLEARGG